MQTDRYYLNENSYVLFGPWDPIVESISRNITGAGGSVSIIGEIDSTAERTLEQISNESEADPNRGKAVHVQCDDYSLENINESLRQSAEKIGALDGFIDCMSMLPGLYSESASSSPLCGFETSMGPTLQVLKSAIEILSSRGRGRVVFVNQNPALYTEPSALWPTALRSSLNSVVQWYSQNPKYKNIGINKIEVSITESLLKTLSRDSESIQATFDRLKQSGNSLTIAPDSSIGSLASFLLGPQSSGISGQSIRI